MSTRERDYAGGIKLVGMSHCPSGRNGTVLHWINRDGYFLDVNGNIINDADIQNDPNYWQTKLREAWERNMKSRSGEAIPPADQTIMVVDKEDGQWTLAERAGADTLKIPYQLNKQFGNPNLFGQDEIVFVDKTTKYARTAIGPDNVCDNAGIFASQTYARASSALASPGSHYLDRVRAEVRTYLRSVPARQDIFPQALSNLLLGPIWGQSADSGRFGRRIAVEEFLNLYPLNAGADTGALPRRDAFGILPRSDAFDYLKNSLGLTNRVTSRDGKTTYVDRTLEEIKRELEGQGSTVDEAAKEANRRHDLLVEINDLDPGHTRGPRSS